jgi:2-polyprenyl-3-methyl-5-hydroxy-6-metoxy-1,4-benzoquinol methylase
MTDERTADDPTVERLDPQAQPDTMMAVEHLARYEWARHFVAGRRVLDAGFGTGFGTRILADAGAEHVVGIDNDASAVEQASAELPENVEFRVSDVATLPFADASFDVVTCMEVIEHVEDPERVLGELHRVLKPDGLLLLSTPNRDVVVPGNPFHLYEFTPEELIGTVSRHFRNVAARRQHTWVATTVMDDATLRQSGPIEGAELHLPASVVPGAEPTTLIAASDGEIPADRLVIEICEPVELRAIDRTFHDQRSLIEDQQRLIDDQAREDRDLRREMTALRTALVEAENDLARMVELESELIETREIADELRDIERQYADLNAAHGQLKAEMDLFLNSTSWKATRPLRRVMAFCRGMIPGR